LIIFQALILLAAVASAQDRQHVANQFVESARSGDSAVLAKLFHYPSTYSQVKQSEDAKGVAQTLAWLFSEFGDIEAAEPSRSKAAFYAFGAMGGTTPYWESISPIDETLFIYDAMFSKVGRGYIQLSVFQAKDSLKPEIRGAGFGIPAAGDNTRAKAIDIMIRLSKYKDWPVPENFRDMLAQHLQPSEFIPAE
jgi:hypothetical protein